MADMHAEEEQAEAVERLAEPAGPCEAEILGSNTAREEALADKAALEKKEKEKVEAALPKLSAAEFRVYNSMAEHMEYFVRFSRFRFVCSFCLFDCCLVGELVGGCIFGG